MPGPPGDRPGLWRQDRARARTHAWQAQPHTPYRQVRFPRPQQRFPRHALPFPHHRSALDAGRAGSHRNQRGRRDPGRDAQDPSRAWRSVPSRKHCFGERACAVGEFSQHRAGLRAPAGMKVTSASVDFPAALAIVREGGSLDADTSARVFETIMTGQVPEADLIAFLTAQARRGPTVPEIVGAVRCMRAAMRPITAAQGAIDLCGTGGDGLDTLNISTAVSFVVAGAGVAVAKHGNRSASSKSGAADILEALNVKIDLEPSRASEVMAETGIVFLFAQLHHPAMRHVGKARATIKQRTIFNLLGPLASPAGVKHQLVGIYSKDWLVPYAEALRALGSTRALVVHGADGLDELTTTDVTHYASLENGQITTGILAPEDGGLPRA